MKNKKGVILLSFFCLPVASFAANRVASLQVDNRTKYQTVDGFGGFGQSPTWGVNMSLTEIDKLWGRGSSQLGYNIMRTIIPSSSQSWAALVPTLKEAQSNGAILFASPWSGPAEFKSNDSLVGGSVLEEHYKDYANWLNSFVDYMAGNGVSIEAVSIQNEPDWTPEYAGTEWSAAQIIKFLKLYGDSIHCKIMAPESLAFRRELSDSILNDSIACSKLGILGGHLYGSMANLDDPLARKKNKKVWMTEYLINENQISSNPVNITWSETFSFAKAINSSMTANMHAWIHYASKRYYGMLGDGTFGTVSGDVTKRGYVLSHYAKYVTGKTRIKHVLSDPSHGLFVSAYQSCKEDSIVVMLINESTDSYSVDFDLPVNVSQYRSVITSNSKNMVNTVATITETSRPQVTVAASSVTTLLFFKSSDRSIPQSYATDSLIYSDSFTDYGGYNYFPDGWQAAFDGGTRYPGTYYSGSRIFFFRPESMIPAGLYIRSTSFNTTGNAIYGMNSSYPLYLKSGSYRLTYSAVGWKAYPKLNCCVFSKNSLSSLVSKDLPLTQKLNGTQGWTVDLNDVNADTLDFEVKTEGNYLLRWSIPYDASLALDGYCEALFGNIQLTPQLTTSLSGDVRSDAKSVQSIRYLNLQGMYVDRIYKGITLIRTTYNDGSVSVKKESHPY
jgi:O-glycosyl hydrolase